MRTDGAVGKSEFASFSLVLVLYLLIKSTENIFRAEYFCWDTAVKKEQRKRGVQRGTDK